MVRNLSHLLSALAGAGLSVVALLQGIPWFFALIPIPVPLLLWHLFILAYDSEKATIIRIRAWAKRNKLDLKLWVGIVHVYHRLPKAKNPVPLVAYRHVGETGGLQSYVQVENADRMFDTIDYAVFGDDQLGMHRILKAIGPDFRQGNTIFEQVCRVMRNKDIDAEHVLRYFDALGSFKEALKAIEMDVPIEYAIQGATP